MTSTSTENYLFDNANPDAALQVRLLGQILDGHTKDILGPLLTERTQHCLDIGAGAGTISHFLADHLDDVAEVVALDKDPQHIPEHELITVRADDVRTADLGSSVYDLIHARLLFMHQPDREDLLTRAVAALKPGGVLVISDWDCTRPDDMLITADPGLRDAFEAFQRALISVGEAVGMDAAWARRLPAAMRAAGLEPVHGLQYNAFWTGGQPGLALHACNSRQLEQPLLNTGQVTGEQLQRLREGMQDPQVGGWSYPLITSVGRRR